MTKMLRRIQKEIDDLSVLDIPYSCEIKDLGTNKVVTKFDDLRYHSVFITLFDKESTVIKIQFPHNYPFVPPIIIISDPLYKRESPYQIPNYNPCTTIVKIIKEFHTNLNVAVETDRISTHDERMSIS